MAAAGHSFTFICYFRDAVHQEYIAFVCVCVCVLHPGVNLPHCPSQQLSLIHTSLTVAVRPGPYLTN